MPKTVRMVVNPTPAGIAIINPKGKVRSMANTTKRKTRKKSTAVAKSSRGRKKITARRNPRSRRRGGLFGFRNPAFVPMITEGIGLAAGSALTAFTVALIPPIGGQGLVADIIRTGATAWLLGQAFKLIGMPAWARLITLGGVALVGGKLIYGVFFPAATAIFQPKQEKAMPAGKGMGSVVTLPAGQYDAYYGSTPQIPSARRAAAAPSAAAAPAMKPRNGMGAVVATRLRY